MTRIINADSIAMNAAVRKACRDGASVKECAETFGLSEDFVCLIVETEGFKSKMLRRLSANAKRDSEICAAYTAGDTIYDCAARFGVTHQRISQIIKKADVETRPKAVAKRNLALCAAYTAGASEEECAEKFGLDRAYALSVLRSAGVELRPISRKKHVARDAELCAAYAAGASRRQCAKQFGLGYTLVLNILDAAGIERRNNTDRDAAICEAYRSGSSVNECAEKFGLTAVSITRVLDAGSIERRRRRHHRRALIGRNAEICQMYASGATTKECIAKFGLSRCRILDVLRQADVELHSYQKSRAPIHRVSMPLTPRELDSIAATEGNRRTGAWSGAEDKILISRYGIVSAGQIGAMLGRTKNQVIGRASRMGLGKDTLE